jgi:hypothetical protein
MDYPPKWQVFNMEQFATAQPRSPGDLGAEVAVQARPNGRMLDHFRVTLGGNRIIDVNFAMAKVLALPVAATWRFKMQTWAKDVEIRRNMTTSEWIDLEDLIASKAGCVYDENESLLAHSHVVARMKEEEEQAALRYGVVVGCDGRLVLMLQALPASADALNSKPTFRG